MTPIQRLRLQQLEQLVDGHAELSAEEIREWLNLRRHERRDWMLLAYGTCSTCGEPRTVRTGIDAHGEPTIALTCSVDVDHDA